ncbi:hypothetical protein LWI28_012917 [Acer negundo]|uniref:Uncharacterized protein n=1 Tax=Acer negundo TaxID=4023 RepID=A0AAD5JDU9_ACENE|nr:hypothetical protein LWI28_012917 [Acer negundo]
MVEIAVGLEDASENQDIHLEGMLGLDTFYGYLSKRGLGVNIICPVCNHANEFTVHALWMCNKAKMTFSSFERPQQPLPPKRVATHRCSSSLKTMPHVTLAEMTKKYGHVMYLKMGICDMMVALTPDTTLAFLKTLDLNFSNCAPNAGATHLAYNAQDMVFMPWQT